MWVLPHEDIGRDHGDETVFPTRILFHCSHVQHINEQRSLEINFQRLLWDYSPATPKFGKWNVTFLGVFGDTEALVNLFQLGLEVILANDAALFASPGTELASNRATLEVCLAFLFTHFLCPTHHPDLS